MRFHHRGLSVVEILVVASISSFILMIAMMVVSRSKTNFRMGTELLDTQLMMEKILSRLNSDFNAMVKLVSIDKDTSLVMKVKRSSAIEEVSYTFDQKTKVLTRVCKKGSQVEMQNFGSAGMIDTILFLQKPGVTVNGVFWPDHVTIALRVVPDEHQKTKVSFSIATQFFPATLIPNPFGR